MRFKWAGKHNRVKLERWLFHKSIIDPQLKDHKNMPQKRKDAKRVGFRHELMSKHIDCD